MIIGFSLIVNDDGTRSVDLYDRSGKESGVPTKVIEVYKCQKCGNDKFHREVIKSNPFKENPDYISEVKASICDKCGKAITNGELWAYK